MNYMDLINLNADKYEKDLATESFIDEYFDMITTESKLDFGFITSTASLESYGVESAIDGGNFGNKFMYYFSKLGNIFTKRQAGFNQAITQMQQINTGKISRGASTIGLNAENAAEYARITEGFNPKIGDNRTAGWQQLMNEMDAAMEDARWEPVREWWEGFKNRVLGCLSFATIILFPLGIYFWVKALIAEFKFYLAIWNLAVDKAEKDIMLVKGVKLITAIVCDITSYIYYKVCPDNPARCSSAANFTATDTGKAVTAIVQKLQDLKTKLNRKMPVEYEEKVRAAETVYGAAAMVYKEKLHMVSPGGVKVLTTGAEALSEKLFASIEGYPDLKISMQAYKGLMVAAELYFDITNKVLLDLYKM